MAFAVGGNGVLSVGIPHWCIYLGRSVLTSDAGLFWSEFICRSFIAAKLFAFRIFIAASQWEHYTAPR